MRRCIAIGLILCLLFTGCALPGKGKQQYQATYLDVFDTVTVISAASASVRIFFFVMIVISFQIIKNGSMPIGPKRALPSVTVLSDRV